MKEAEEISLSLTPLPFGRSAGCAFRPKFIGSRREHGLIADAAGDLFGTTSVGGAYGDGTVFEIANTASGYASTPTVLASFNGANGSSPFAGLIADPTGDLFGEPTLADFNEDLQRRGLHDLRAALRVELVPDDVARFLIATDEVEMRA